MSHRPPVSPLALIVGARVLVGLDESGDHAFVAKIRRDASVDPTMPWDLAFIHHVGWRSHCVRIGLPSAWPFDRTATHDEIGRVARTHGLLVKRPAEGDIVLYWCDALERLTRAGIVVALNAVSVDAGRTVYHCTTIECDTACGDARGVVREHETSICPDRGDLLVRSTWSDGRQARIDSRPLGPARARASWEYDEQLGRCA